MKDVTMMQMNLSGRWQRLDYGLKGGGQSNPEKNKALFGFDVAAETRYGVTLS